MCTFQENSRFYVGIVVGIVLLEMSSTFMGIVLVKDFAKGLEASRHSPSRDYVVLKKLKVSCSLGMQENRLLRDEKICKYLLQEMDIGCHF